MELTRRSATDLARAIRQKEVSSREVVDAHLAHIARHNPRIGAFLRVDEEGARAAADRIDARLAAGEEVGPLAGVPVAVKDNICIAGELTTCASRMLENYRPPYTAHVVDLLREAGAVILGKTNMDEFAMGSSCENSALGRTCNPWNYDHVPGGSSGGSAAAVAAGFAPLALGSDTGGSIRAPASFCGVVGMKPTYGAVSRRGLVAFGSSLDQIGPFARTVEDAALALRVLARPDPRDSTCALQPPQGLDALAADATGLRVGVPRAWLEMDGLEPVVRARVLAAVETLAGEGATLVDVSLPLIDYAVPTYYIVATAEASSNLARFDGVHYGHRSERGEDLLALFSHSREEGFGPEVKRRIMLGTYVLSAGYYDAYYLRALKVRRRIAEDFDAAFANADVIAAPVTPGTAFAIGAIAESPLQMYLQDIYTISVNLAALPGISLPCGTDASGLPIGLQLIAPRFRDATALRAAAVCERGGGGGNRVAPL